MKEKSKELNVEIEVKGGVAYLVKKSRGITVCIRDYDNANADEQMDYEEDKYEASEQIDNE